MQVDVMLGDVVVITPVFPLNEPRRSSLANIVRRSCRMTMIVKGSRKWPTRKILCYGFLNELAGLAIAGEDRGE